jgi:hypothetical protein
MYPLINDISFVVELISSRYCEFMKEDPLTSLQHCSKEDIMAFLKWTLDHYQVRKKSSLHEYWKIWRMLYRCVGRSLHAKIVADINDVCSLLFALGRVNPS